MTAEESALKQFQDEPFFEVLVQSISRKATAYAYAQLVQKSNLGSGNTVDCIIKEQVQKTTTRQHSSKNTTQTHQNLQECKVLFHTNNNTCTVYSRPGDFRLQIIPDRLSQRHANYTTRKTIKLFVKFSKIQ